MITTQIQTINNRQFLAAIAPSGAILTRRMLGSTLTREQIAARSADFAAHWARRVYQSMQPACIVSRCEDVLL